jgi:hypothetical protein
MAETKLTYQRYRELIDESLFKAECPVMTFEDTGEALRGIVAGFNYLIEIVAEQRERIESLEDQLQAKQSGFQTDGMI